MARSSRKTLTGSAVTAAKKVISRRPRSEDVVEAATGAAKKAASSAAKKAAPTAKKAASSAAKKAAPTAKKAASSAARKAAPVAKKAASDAAKKAAPAAKKAAASAAKKAATSAVKRATPARKTTSSRGAAGLVVLEGEDAWTKAELDEVLAELNEHAARLRRELHEQEEELAGLLRDAGDGAGHDQADMGATSFERDQELSVVANALEMLAQTERALSRITDGSYGVCESCGNPIGKMRVMAFPRATLCMSCKQREERR